MVDDDRGGFLDGTTRYDEIVGGVDGIAEMIQHLFVPSHRLHRRSGRCHELVGRGQASRVPHRDASLDLLADLRLDEVGASRPGGWAERGVHDIVSVVTMFADPALPPASVFAGHEPVSTSPALVIASRSRCQTSGSPCPKTMVTTPSGRTTRRASANALAIDVS